MHLGLTFLSLLKSSFLAILITVAAMVDLFRLLLTMSIRTKSQMRHALLIKHTVTIIESAALRKSSSRTANLPENAGPKKIPRYMDSPSMGSSLEKKISFKKFSLEVQLLAESLLMIS